MLILHAHNTTGTKADGTSDYDVEVRVNERVIARLRVTGHIRKDGGAALLRRIADRWETAERAGNTW